LNIAQGIASAAGHLHAQGIMHGDLYAHNILNTLEGNALLGDFGAACFFNAEDIERATALQRLEIRAFGCLLEELLTHCDEADKAPEAVATLWDLQRRCVQLDVADRPLFAEVSTALAGL
jgi:tRNA A-37 threonylcarbamoyl transferase component Bud32